MAALQSGTLTGGFEGSGVVHLGWLSYVIRLQA
jgi:hypothetical protein